MKRGLLLLVVLALPSVARAGNEDSYFQGNEAALFGGAVVAFSSDASSVWYNPAGLGSNERNKLDLSGSAFVLRVRTVDAGLVAELGTDTASNDLRSVDVLSVPSALAMARELRDGLSIGVGVFVSAQDSFAIHGAPRTLESGNVTLGTTVRAAGGIDRYHAGVGLGWEPNRHVRIGATLLGVYERTDLSFRATLEATTRGDDGLRSGHGVLIADGDLGRSRIALEGVVGLQLEPTERLRIGLALRTPRLLLKEFLDYESLASLSAVLPPFPPTVELTFYDEPESAGVGMIAPLRAVLGVGVVFDRGALSIEGDLSHAVDRPEAGVDIEPTWNVRAGGRFDASEAVSFGFGAFTDRSTAPDVSESSVLSSTHVDYYGGSFGMSLRTPVELGADENARTIVFSTTFGLRYAVGVGEFARGQIDVDLGDALAPITASVEPTDVVWHEVSLHVGSAVDF